MEDNVPHFLRLAATDPSQFEAPFFNNVAMRVGEVVEIHYPESPANQTKKKQTQYTVRVQHRNGQGMLVDVLYRCTVGDLFGGIADHVRYTARKRSKDSRTLGNGARVLIACPNGETNAAVIIGGIKHESAAPDHGKADGHHFEFEFNGVQFQINDGGKVVLKSNGATDADGKSDDSKTKAENRGSSVTLDPTTGKVLITNGGTESVEIDTATKTINLRAGGDWRLHADQTVVISGKTIRIGSDSASEPLVLGHKLQQALTALVNAFQNSKMTFAQGPMMHPALAAALAAWLGQYGSGPYLSSDKFTE